MANPIPIQITVSIDGKQRVVGFTLDRDIARHKTVLTLIANTAGNAAAELLRQPKQYWQRTQDTPEILDEAAAAGLDVSGIPRG